MFKGLLRMGDYLFRRLYLCTELWEYPICLFILGLQIDIWCNKDGSATANLLYKDLKRIFTYQINQHDVSTLYDPSCCKYDLSM